MNDDNDEEALLLKLAVEMSLERASSPTEENPDDDNDAALLEQAIAMSLENETPSPVPVPVNRANATKFNGGVATSRIHTYQVIYVPVCNFTPCKVPASSCAAY